LPGTDITMAGPADSRWKFSPLTWMCMIAAGAILVLPFHAGLARMVGMWATKEEYSYGYMIPLVTAFLIWDRRDELARTPFHGSWLGVLVTIAGFGLLVVGELSTIWVIVQYAFLVALFGVALAFTGWPAFRVIWVPLFLLAFMVPLPQFALQEISTRLQLVSSELGVLLIRLAGIGVFLEGNVIDLGKYKLEVAEACSGLRYLFPLTALGFIAAYLFKGPLWKRAVIFLSTIPITVLMNSFRIGMIGVLVEYAGRSMAEGFLHDFEGWTIFLACTALLVLEMWILARIGTPRMSLAQAFAVNWPSKPAAVVQPRFRAVPKPYWGALAVTVASAVVAMSLPERAETVPARKDFAQFPMQLGDWKGRPDRLDQIYLAALKLNDYFLADFVDDRRKTVNVYAAYYASQRTGESAHSPRTCIPGGGWVITSFAEKPIEDVSIGGRPLRVNRAVIQLGDRRQLTYYWFQERGRIVTNEYLVKWFIFWDALTRNRSDGALVRLVTPINPGEEVADADQRLSAFARLLSVHVESYVPG